MPFYQVTGRESSVDSLDGFLERERLDEMDVAGKEAFRQGGGDDNNNNNNNNAMPPPGDADSMIGHARRGDMSTELGLLDLEWLYDMALAGKEAFRQGGGDDNNNNNNAMPPPSGMYHKMMEHLSPQELERRAFRDIVGDPERLQQVVSELGPEEKENLRVALKACPNPPLAEEQVPRQGRDSASLPSINAPNDQLVQEHPSQEREPIVVDTVADELPKGHIVAGRGQRYWASSENEALRNHVHRVAADYQATPDQDKKEFGQSIVAEYNKKGVWFLVRDETWNGEGERWVEIPPKKAREKVQQLLSDAVTLRKKVAEFYASKNGYSKPIQDCFEYDSAEKVLSQPSIKINQFVDEVESRLKLEDYYKVRDTMPPFVQAFFPTPEKPLNVIKRCLDKVETAQRVLRCFETKDKLPEAFKRPFATPEEAMKQPKKKIKQWLEEVG